MIDKNNNSNFLQHAARFTLPVAMAALLLLIVTCGEAGPSVVSPGHAPVAPTATSQPKTKHSQSPSSKPSDNDCNFPIFDMHAHWQPDLPVDFMIESMDRANVKWAVIMPNQGREYDATMQLTEISERFYPFVGFQNRGWLEQRSGFLLNLRKALGTGKFKGLGEVLLRHYAVPERGAPDVYIPATNESVSQVVDIAAEYNVPVVIHMEAEEKTVSELEKLLRMHPNTNVIRAHAGRSDISMAGKMLSTYPNLYIDLAVLDPSRRYGRERNSITTADGKLRLEWKELLTKFRYRVVTGSDIPFQDQWSLYVHIMDSQRALLDQLPRQVAEDIGYRTAAGLLGASLPYGMCFEK